MNAGSGFGFIQFPVNIIEQMNTDSSLIQWAKSRKIEIGTTRPLTAFDESGSWRLAEYSFPEEYISAKDNLLQHLTPPSGAGAEEMEASDWMRNLIMRLDEQLSLFTSIVHWEAELAERIFPMIDEAFEEMDSQTLDLLGKFFTQYGLAVKESGGHAARLHLLEKYPALKDSQVFQEAPLQKSAFDYVFKKTCIDIMTVHATDPVHIDEWKKWANSS